MRPTRGRPIVGFVLGGGGHLGAVEVGMLRALVERAVTPDLVVGTSVGALNGAAVAARPDAAGVERLEAIWRRLADDPVLGGTILSSAASLVRTRTALYSNARLRRLIHSMLPVATFEELDVPFQCVAASIERAAEHWFSSGPLEPAILASSAVPGLLPPVEVDGEHFVDGGLVNSIPLQRAVHLGATEVYVLHVGRIERALSPPRTLIDAAVVSFEIARRHRFARDLAEVPAGVTVHVLPVGGRRPPGQRRPVRVREPRRARDVEDDIERAYRSTVEYLRRRS